MTDRVIFSGEKRIIHSYSRGYFKISQDYDHIGVPWVPEGFFFRSEAAIVSGEAAIVIHAREKKNPLDAAVTSLTSMRF